MTDLNTFLLDELAHATAQGREVAFHLSNTLTNAIDQVNQSGVILNSMNDGEDFLEFIDNIGHQFHPFNTAKVVAVNAADYAGLDAQQKFIFSHIMEFVSHHPSLTFNHKLTFLSARSSDSPLSSSTIAMASIDFSSVLSTASRSSTPLRASRLSPLELTL